MNRRTRADITSLPSLESQRPQVVARVDVFEPRLALSVNAAADVLVDLFSADQGTVGAYDPLAAAAATRQQTGLDGSGQTIAVIDTGIAWDHVAFANRAQTPGIGPGQRIVGGWDFAENDALPYDDGPAGYHGTHIAATIAGDSTDAPGVAPKFHGIAPGADLVALRVFDDYGKSNLEWIESSLRWVLDHRTSFESPITTVNLSLGSFAIDAGQSLNQLDDEILALRQSGILIFAAAGNSYSAATPDQLAYPASHPLVTAVTSVDAQGLLQSFAQRSNNILATVGDSVRSAVPDHVYGIDGKINDFASLSGTSMATAQLAGMSLLVRQSLIESGIEQPTPDQVLDALYSSATVHQDAASELTYRVIDLEDALQQTSQVDAPAAAVGVEVHWGPDQQLFIRGTAENDDVEVDLSGQQPRIRVNGVPLALDRIAKEISLDGGTGNDTLQLIGSGGDERLIARNSSLSTEANNISFERTGLLAKFGEIENLVFRGGGGNDRATLFDSQGDDQLESTAKQVTLRGIGYSFVTVDVNQVYAHGTAGGKDVAYLYDTAQDDHLAVRHQFTSLRSEQQFRLAYGFEKVFAFAGQGGHDDAALYDSPGDDRMSASGQSAWISGQDYYAGASGFAEVTAQSSAGGNDYATFYSTNRNDHWLRTAQYVQWDSHAGTSRVAQGFGRFDLFVNMQPIQITTSSSRSLLLDLEKTAAHSFFERYGEPSPPSVF